MTQKIRIYTELYSPFRMGGDLHEPIACVVEALGPFELGKGFKAYVVADPDGNIVIAEERSGGLIGDSISSVKSDVKKAKTPDMKKQVAEGVRRSERAREIPAEEFWRKRNG